ncbi:MAG TPA: prepilin-type N-terminal cleavage/methylation domain-containing protein [Candidatus Binatia bacterium]|jgi:general secretion pathway protein I
MTRPRQRGFTLLEVLIATAILGIAIVTLLGLHARNLALAAEAEQLTVAGTLASDVLALAQLDPEIEEGTLRGTFAPTREQSDGQAVIYGGAMSDRYVWTRDVTPTALETLKQVRVRVSLAGDEDHSLAELWAALHVQVQPQ